VFSYENISAQHVMDFPTNQKTFNFEALIGANILFIECKVRSEALNRKLKYTKNKYKIKEL